MGRGPLVIQKVAPGSHQPPAPRNRGCRTGEPRLPDSKLRDRGLAPQANPAAAPLGHSVPRAGVSYDPSPPRPWSEKTPNLRWGGQLREPVPQPHWLRHSCLQDSARPGLEGSRNQPSNQAGVLQSKGWICLGLQWGAYPVAQEGGGWGVPTCPHTPCPENRPLQPVSDLSRSHWAGPPHEAGTFHFPRMPPGQAPSLPGQAQLLIRKQSKGPGRGTALGVRILRRDASPGSQRTTNASVVVCAAAPQLCRHPPQGDSNLNFI